MIRVTSDSVCAEKFGNLISAGSTQVWEKHLSDGGFAVVLLNLGDAPAQVAASVPGHWRVRDLWQHAEIDASNGTLSADVPAHGAVMLRLSR